MYWSKHTTKEESPEHFRVSYEYRKCEHCTEKRTGFVSFVFSSEFWTVQRTNLQNDGMSTMLEQDWMHAPQSGKDNKETYVPNALHKQWVSDPVTGPVWPRGWVEA